MPTQMDLVIAGRPQTSRIYLDASLAQLPALAAGRQAALVVDANVRRLHGARLPDWPLIEIEASEAAKTLATFERLTRALIELGVDRSTLIVGIGGGITCDLTGFVGSTLLRGLPFGLVPTTLLAQVDAAVGGKNGVNLDGLKNLVGTVTQPEFVLSDHSVLATLPPREVRCGIAEAIKTAVVGDAALFELIEVGLDALLQCDREVAARVVEGAVRTKVRIVAGDERDQGQRRLLNFGHTLGHAIEKVFRLSHGEAVAAGMTAAGRISVQRGLLPAREGQRLERLIARAGLPVSCPPGRWPDLVEAIGHDKKRLRRRQAGVLLRALGDGVIVDIGDDEWREGRP
jgi:3-dehydroquinate synthase